MQVLTMTIIRKAIGAPLRRPCCLRRDSSCNIPVSNFFASPAVRFCWYLAAYFPVGLPVLREAWNGMRQRDFFTEYTLMSLAAIGAFYIGEYPEGVAVMLFYSIGEALQERAVERARRYSNT